MDAATRDRVRQRAGNCCEYCRLAESAHDRAFHIEHIVARQHGGGDEEENLALACDRCNLCKGPNLTGIDSLTRQIATLFHPRRDDWNDHFQWDGSSLVGKTPTGRTTIHLLKINAPARVELRERMRIRGGEA
jgi:HNH endonuclease